MHHIGMTVLNLDRSIRFYELLLRAKPTLRRFYREDYISELFAFSNMEMDVAFFELPGRATVLELAEFRHPASVEPVPDWRRAGSVHFGILVEDLEKEVQRLRAAGTPFRSGGPINIPLGPYAGWRTIFAIDPDGIGIQLMGPPQAVPEETLASAG